MNLPVSKLTAAKPTFEEDVLLYPSSTLDDFFRAIRAITTRRKLPRSHRDDHIMRLEISTSREETTAFLNRVKVRQYMATKENWEEFLRWVGESRERVMRVRCWSRSSCDCVQGQTAALAGLPQRIG